MVLRDIYLELSTILDLKYEKNQNGSYRVNTVIASLVYPDLYMNGEFSENELCYFLKHAEYSYQHYPNIRNSFSELMNPKNGSNRFPVTEFADLLEVEKLYAYYSKLIDPLDLSKQEALKDFIERTLEQEPLIHSKLKLLCTRNHEYLTWIVIFSMFNKDIAEDKFNNYINSVQNVSEYYGADESSDHNFSISLQRKAGQLNIITALLITLVCIQFLLAFAPHFMKSTIAALPKWASQSYYIFIILYSFATLGVWIWHALTTSKQTDLKMLFHFKNNYPDFTEDSLKGNFNVKPHNSVLEKRRSNFRKTSMTLTLFLCTLMLIPAVILKSFPLFIGLSLIWILSYMCLDRIVSSYSYRTFYDGLTARKKLNPYRGLAKIYRWEYEKTRFNFKNKYYHNHVPIHGNECYKNIFFMSYDRNRWALLDLYLLILFINFYFLVIALLGSIIGNKSVFFRLPAHIDINLLIMVYLATIGVFCIITALCNKSYFTASSFAKYSLAHINRHPEDAAKLYISMQSENILREIDVARGIYVYNIARFEQGDFTEDIFPETDRMLYYHQSVTYKAALKITYWFAYFILFFLLIWHAKNLWLFIPVTIIVPAMYVISYRFFIDKIHYKRIIKEINKLSSSAK